MSFVKNSPFGPKFGMVNTLDKGVTIIWFLGFPGGKLVDLCDVKIHVQSEPGEYGPVEDAHLIMNHILLCM